MSFIATSVELAKKNEEKDFAGMGMEQFFNRKKTLASALNRMSLLLLREKKGDRIKKKSCQKDPECAFYICICVDTYCTRVQAA
jgi:hypothetical protein